MKHIIHHLHVQISNASQLNPVTGKVLKTLENMVLSQFSSNTEGGIVQTNQRIRFVLSDSLWLEGSWFYLML